MNAPTRIALALTISIDIAGCSHAATGGTSVLPVAPVRESGATSGVLLVRVSVDRTQRRPHYLSPSTKGMTVDVRGPTNFKKTVGLSVSAAGCRGKLMTLQCILRVPGLKSCSSNKACYTAEVRTYDAYANKKIPAGAHLLSAVNGLKFRVGSGTTLVPLVLDGIPSSVAFIPSASGSLSGTQSSGFIFPKCNSSVQTVSLVALDADGNYIVGPGAPALSLASANTAQLSVTSAGLDTFFLHPPTTPNYAYGNYRIRLTATARPRGKGPTALTAVNVRYSGDICGIITEFNVPTSSSHPAGITAGPDGAIWFTEISGQKIGRVMLDGKITEYGLPPLTNPLTIVAGPDGALWFTASYANAIGRITTAGVITETPVPTASSQPFGLTNGPDGNLWFTETSGNQIGRLTTSRVITEFPIPTAGSGPTTIVSGPKNALWFTENYGNRLASIATSGAVTEYSPFASGSGPYGVTVGPDQTLWVTQQSSNAIAVATAYNVTISTFPLPESGSGPQAIVVGPDGAAWFTENAGGRIGRVTPTGVFSEYSATTPSILNDLTVGPDGAIWFVEETANKIARLI